MPGGGAALCRGRGTKAVAGSKRMECVSGGALGVWAWPGVSPAFGGIAGRGRGAHLGQAGGGGGVELGAGRGGGGDAVQSEAQRQCVVGRLHARVRCRRQPNGARRAGQAGEGERAAVQQRPAGAGSSRGTPRRPGSAAAAAAPAAAWATGLCARPGGGPSRRAQQASRCVAAWRAGDSLCCAAARLHRPRRARRREARSMVAG